MRIKNEDEILDQAVRSQIIEEILGTENQKRKDKAYKRYRIFKDMTKEFVIKELEKQFSEKTVQEMSFCTSNISVVRKIVEKLSKVYAGGVQRSLETEEATTQVEDVAKCLKLNQTMKKSNRLVKLQKNIMLMPKPCPVVQPDGSQKYSIKIDVLSPYLYDVVEDYYDREKPMVLVLSNYKTDNVMRYALNPEQRNKYGRAESTTESYSDGTDQIIADNPVDAQSTAKDTFVFWSSRYHFTCDQKGNIISGPDIQNPINMFPGVSVSQDQDGQYWSQGGDDLIDAGVLVNSMITHLNYIGVMQGYGQFYMTGKNLPTNVIVGPNKVIKLEYEEGEPKPELGFAQATPQLQELMKSIEMYVALTLTTNNLTTSGVSMQLSGASSFASGVALMIDKAESIEDVKDQEQIYQDAEPEIWKRISAWWNVYGANGYLVPELQEKKMPKSLDGMTLKFHGIQPIMSEGEKLDNIQKRKDLGISTMIDMIMLDNPGMTQEQAQQKLIEITKEKMLRVQSSLIKTEPMEVEYAEEEASEDQTEEEVMQ